MRLRLAIIVALLIHLVGCAEPARDTSRSWDAGRIEQLQQAMPTLLDRHSVPGMAIALTVKSSVQWSAGFGVSFEDGPPITASTTFQAASLGKPVFAHVVHRFLTAQALPLMGNIETWAPDSSYPPAVGSLTSAQLLSHTSGLVFDEEQDRLRVDLDSKGDWRYSGTGYALLQRLVEHAASNDINLLASHLLFKPAKLESLSYLRSPGGLAVAGHDRQGRPLRQSSGASPEAHSANVGSSLHASANGYAGFLLAAAASEEWAELTTSVVPVRPELGLSWGLGWSLSDTGAESPTAFHWGSNPGFKSLAFFDANRGLGLVILTNGDHGLELAREVVELVDPQRQPFFDFYMLHPDD